MSPTRFSGVDRSSAAHIGRIGGLAVALGIGAAVITGTPVAWADNSAGTAASTQQEAATTAAMNPAPARRAARGPAAAQRTAAAANSAGAADSSAPAPRRGANRAAAAAQRPSSAASRKSVAPSPSASTAPRAAATVTPADANPAPDLVSVPADPVSVPVATVAVTPVPVAAPQGTVSAPRLASRLLSAVGLAPQAGSTTPGVPADSPALWAMLGWTRRDAGRVGVRTAAATAALPGAAVANALVTTPANLSSTPIGWVTGQRNTAFPGAGWTQTNNTRWANVYGTDLGIMWFNGDNSLTQLAFGDTFSGANMSGDWRSNILLLSDDTNLSDGLTLINTGPAYQFIPAAKSQVFFIGSEVTNIPTSAVYANSKNYVSYMSVKSWDTPGRWTTNYSAISQYDPATDKWVLQKQTVRPAGYFRSSTMYKAGDQNFQQMAYVLEPESKVAAGGTRYVYAFGTPSGRSGSAFLSRVPEGSVTDLSRYEYWDGNAWVTNQAKAAPVIGDSTKSTGLLGPLVDLANDPKFLGGSMAGFLGAKTGGNVSEMSVQYNEYLDKYVVLYGNGANNVILRTADTPEGPWSDPVTIATSIQYPGLYAPMIHPLSGTGALTDGTNPDISNLYWNMSIWGNYNVVLMKTDLGRLKVTTV